MFQRLLTGLLCLGGISILEAQENTTKLAEQARAVLRQHCQRCHHGPGSEGGEFNVLSRGDMVEQSMVVPGKVADSYLWERVEKDQMPPRNIRQRLTEAEKQSLQDWIKAGAPEFVDQQVTRKFKTLVAVLHDVKAALRKADSKDRAFLRFFTLHHLHNNSQVTDDDLRLYRAALSKALNSVSWKPRIVLPQAVDAEQTLFVIDVRELDWDRDNLWYEIMRAYPYGLKYRNHPTDELVRLDEELCELTGCDQALVRGDWFIATATRPPLYHTLLRIPEHAGKLEQQLSVNIAQNFQNPQSNRIARAGFAKSGVSGQNRLLERLEATHGAYWKSYDFKPDTARAKLTRFPLGPLNLFPAGEHPYAHQAFAHDGGEIIFNLPNGLQGYMLVDGEDRRIDEGPIAVVSDSLKTSGTPAIVNGVSCMACHKHGAIRFRDSIRLGSAVFGDAERKVKELYPEQVVMDRLVQADSDRFLAALDRAISPFLRVGPDKNKPLTTFAEPVGEAARLYRLGYLDLEAVACELDVADPQEIVRQVGERKLKQLGLESLLKQKGLIGRLEWQAVDGVSLMQELARELRFTPFSVD